MDATNTDAAPGRTASKTPPRDYTPNGVDVDRIREALQFIDSSDRNTWVHIGMAIKAGLADTGFDVWEEWSAGADNYDPRAAKDVWRSIREGGKVTIGTLFHEAKKNGYVHSANDRPAPPTPEQIAVREAKRQAAEAEQAKRRADAASNASSIWKSALEAGCPAVNEHAYLTKKGIQSHGIKVYLGSLTIGGMDCNGSLMLPIKFNGKITSLQFINHEGEKRFLPGGEKGGFLIGTVEDGKPICIVEGFATGASIHEATGYPVIVAFDAGNLRKMAEAVRGKNPDAVIVICADMDDNNVGQLKASEAALAVDGVVAFPSFGGGADHE